MEPCNYCELQDKETIFSPFPCAWWREGPCSGREHFPAEGLELPLWRDACGVCTSKPMKSCPECMDEEGCGDGWALLWSRSYPGPVLFTSSKSVMC